MSNYVTLMIYKEHTDLKGSGPLTQPLPRASMIHNTYGDMLSRSVTNAGQIICTLVQVGDCWIYALEANNRVIIVTSQ